MKVLKKSPLKHKGSPPHLTKGPEHDEWHKNYSTMEDSPEAIEAEKLKEEERKRKINIQKKESKKKEIDFDFLSSQASNVKTTNKEHLHSPELEMELHPDFLQKNKLKRTKRAELTEEEKAYMQGPEYKAYLATEYPGVVKMSTYKPIEVDPVTGAINSLNANPEEINKHYVSNEYINTQPVLKQFIDNLTASETDYPFTDKEKVIKEYRNLIASGGVVTGINPDYDPKKIAFFGNDLFISTPIPSFNKENKKTGDLLNIVPVAALTGENRSLFFAATDKSNMLWGKGMVKQGIVRNYKGVATMSEGDASLHFGISRENLKYYDFKYDKNLRDYVPIEKLNEESNLESDFNKDKKVQKNISAKWAEIQEKQYNPESEEIKSRLDKLREKAQSATTKEEFDEIKVQYDEVLLEMDNLEKRHSEHYKTGVDGDNYEFANFRQEQFTAFATTHDYTQTLAEAEGVILPSTVRNDKGEFPKRYKVREPGTDKNGDYIVKVKREMSLDQFKRVKGSSNVKDLNYSLDAINLQVNPMVSNIFAGNWSENDLADNLKAHLSSAVSESYADEGWKVETMTPGQDHVRVTRPDGSYFDLIPNTVFNRGAGWYGVDAFRNTYEDINDGEDYSKDGMEQINSNILSAWNEFVSRPLDHDNMALIHKTDKDIVHTELAMYHDGSNSQFLTNNINDFDGKAFNAWRENKGEFGYPIVMTTEDKEEYVEVITNNVRYIFNNPQADHDNSSSAMGSGIPLPANSGGYTEEHIQEIKRLAWTQAVNEGHKMDWENFQTFWKISGPSIIHKIQKENSMILKENDRISGISVSDDIVESYTNENYNALKRPQEKDIVDLNKKNDELNEEIMLLEGRYYESFSEYHEKVESTRAVVIDGTDEQKKDLLKQIEDLKAKQDENRKLVEAKYDELNAMGVEGYESGMGTYDKQGMSDNGIESYEKAVRTAQSEWAFILQKEKVAGGLVKSDKEGAVDYYKFLVTQDLDYNKEAENTFISFKKIPTKYTTDADRGTFDYQKSGGVVLEPNKMYSIKELDDMGLNYYGNRKNGYSQQDWSDFNVNKYWIDPKHAATWEAWAIKKNGNKAFRDVFYQQAYLEKDIKNIKAFKGSRSPGFLWTGAVKATASLFTTEDQADEWAAYLSTTDDAVSGHTDAYVLDKMQEIAVDYNDVHSTDISEGLVPSLEFNEEQTAAMTRGYWDTQNSMIGGFVPTMGQLIGLTYMTGGSAIPLRVASLFKKGSKWSKFAKHAAAFTLEEIKLQSIGFKPLSGGTFYLSHLGVSAIPMPRLLKAASDNIFGVRPLLKTAQTGGVMALTLEAATTTEAYYESKMFGTDFGLEMDHLFGDSEELTQRMVQNAFLGKVYGTYNKGGKNWKEKIGFGQSQWITNRGINKAIVDVDAKILDIANKNSSPERKWVDNKDGTSSLIETKNNIEGILETRNTKEVNSKNKTTTRETEDLRSYEDIKGDLLNMGVNRLLTSKLDPQNPEVYAKAKEKFELEVDANGNKKWTEKQVEELANNEVKQVFIENHNEMVWEPFKKSFTKTFGQEATNGMSIGYYYGSGGGVRQVSINGKIVKFDVDPITGKDLGNTAEFRPNKDGTGTVLIDVNKYDPGKSTHEIFIHAELNAIWNRDAAVRGVSKEQVQREFVGLIKDNFSGFDFKTSDGTPLGDRLAEMYGGGETFKKYTQEYKDLGQTQKQAEQSAFDKMQLEGKDSKYWDQKQNEEFLGHMIEMLTQPKHYYSEVAPNAFREARLDLMNWFREATGKPGKITTTKEFIDILGVFSKSVRTGRNFSTTWETLSHNLSKVYKNGREKGKPGDVLVDIPISTFEIQHNTEKMEAKQEAKASKNLDKQVKEVEDKITGYEKLSKNTQSYYKENIESQSNNTQRRKNILEFTRPNFEGEFKEKSVAGDYWDKIIWKQVDIASKKMNLTEADKYALALELVSDKSGKGTRGLTAIIEQYYQYTGKPSKKKQPLTKTVSQTLKVRVIDMIKNLEVQGLEGGKKGKEFSEMIDISEISETVAGEGGYKFQPEIKGKGKGINVFKRLGIDKSNPMAENIIFERGKKIILEASKNNYRDLEYNFIGRKSTDVVRPIIEREFSFNENLKEGLTKVYLNEVGVKDVKQLSNVQKGKLNEILLDGANKYIDKNWETLVKALPKQLNESTLVPTNVLKTWGGTTKNPSPIYIRDGNYTYKEMKQVNKDQNMGWTDSYMRSGPPKFVKNENISKEAFTDYIYKKPDGGKLRFEQVETRINSLIDFVTSTVATQKTKDLLNNPVIQDALFRQNEGALEVLKMENTLKRVGQELSRVSQRIKGSLPESLASKDIDSQLKIIDNFLREYKKDWGNKTIFAGPAKKGDVTGAIATWINKKINSNPDYKAVLGPFEKAILKDLKVDIPTEIAELQQKFGEVNRALNIIEGKVVAPMTWESGSWKGGVNKTIIDFLTNEYIKREGKDGLSEYLSELNINKGHQERLNDVKFMKNSYLPMAKKMFESMPKELHGVIAKTILFDGQYKMDVAVAGELGIKLTGVKNNKGLISSDFKNDFIKDLKGSGKPFMVEINGKQVNGVDLVKRVDNGTLKFNLLGWRINKEGKKVYKENSKGERVPGVYDLPQFADLSNPKTVKKFAEHVKDNLLSNKGKTYEDTVIANETLMELFYTELFNNYKKSENKIEAINNIQFLLQSQTSIGQGITRALATHTAVTTKKELLHSEHEFQVMNFNGNFITNMLQNAGSKKTFTENLKPIIKIFKQSIIPKELQKLLDSKEHGGKLGFIKDYVTDIDAKFNFIKEQSVLSTIIDLKTGTTYDALSKHIIQSGQGVKAIEAIRSNLVKKLDKHIGSNASKDLTNAEIIEKLSIIDKAVAEGRKRKKKRQGGSFWDLDDTLITTKSGVRATIPNPSGKPKPNRKVIFLAGGAGSGKGNVIKKLGLEKDGFKIVNQDISLEWLKKNNGLPENMNDLTSAQRSKLGSLQHQARSIAKRKMMKYQGEAEGVVVDGTGGSIKTIEGLVKEFKDKGYDVSMLFVETSLETALQRNKARKERSLLDKIVIKNHEAVQGNKGGFKAMFSGRFMEVKTDNLKQGDAMPGDLVSKVNDFVSGYEKIRLDAEQFASEGKDILDRGGEFDFTEFNVITKGETLPMFQTALNRQKKFGTKDQFIVTARPPEAQVPIYEFLKSQGLNIPLKNIKGLGNSTAEAKAMYILEKFAEGYNDIYFADDARQNVEAVRDVLSKVDVKSKVVQAKKINDVKDVGRLDSPDVFGDILASKDLRSEYEKTISKRRPDLVKEGLVSKTVDEMIKFVEDLNVPINKRKKYQRITTKWLATSNIKLKEDGYKVKDAVELAEKYKEDIFSYKNPNQIIEKYAGKAKAEPTNPKTVKEFTENVDYDFFMGKEIVEVYSKEYGITEHIVENTKEGQLAVRKVMDTHFGENSNPWCLAQKKNGKLTESSWEMWEHYSDGPKSLVFQNGKLIGFKANGEYWDRMDNATDAPVITVKEGRVTKTVELVPINGKVSEFVAQTKTTSKDKKTVTTEYHEEKSIDPEGYYFHPEGTKVVENKVNGITVQETIYKPNGKIRKVTKFENSKAIEARAFMLDGKTTRSINNVASIDVNKHGDRVNHELGEVKTDYWFGEVSMEAKGLKDVPSDHQLDGKNIYPIGFKTKKGFEVMDIMERVNGKLRVNFDKLRKIDPDVKGLPKEIVKPVAREGVQTLEPVKKVLDQLDIKSETQQSLASKDLNKDFNKILEEVKGIGREKIFSEGKAKEIGRRKGVWKWWGSSGMEDFQGLITYAFAGKGKKGEGHKKFFDDNLQKPYNRAYNEIHSIKQTMSNDYTALRKSMPEVTKQLRDKVGGSVYTVENAIRTYLWNKAGYEVPGMSKRDVKLLDNFVKSNEQLVAFAETLSTVTKLKEGYAKPKDYWLAETITGDLQRLADGHYRDLSLTEFKENREAIFGKWEGGKLVGDNMNKIEATYGTKHRENIEGMLYAMETGQNRPYGTDAITNKWMNWINNAGGTIMFFNVKSSALQTISNINYMNGTFNNPFAAAKAFANQPQYWKDFAKIFNSDMLLQRRSGLKINIEASELTNRLSGKDNKAQRALSYLLEKGFLPTKYADSFAIAMGGSTFYRNRIKSLMKEGMSKAQAEKQAWIEFTEVTEATQQSSRPDFISAQQRSAVGRPILMFGNTPMQMFRRHKRRIQDIVNNRGNRAENIMSAAYYGVVQASIFSFLANAMFAKDEDDLEKEESGFNEKKDARFTETIIDSYLRGMGIMGAVPAALKNGIQEFITQNEKDHNADYDEVVFDLLNVSPPIGSKIRKLSRAGDTWKYNKDIVSEMGFSLDNPMVAASANVISALTNVPLDRVNLKIQNLRDASNSDYKTWERIALLTGINRWSLGLGKQDAVVEAEQRVDEAKKIESEVKKQEKKRTKLKEKYPDKTGEEIDVIVKSKELFSLSKQTQIDILKSLDVSDKDIKKLKKEKDRTDKIAELYKDNSKLIDNAIKTSKSKPKPKKKEEVKLSKSEQYKKDLFKLKKKDQVNLLIEYGLGGRAIKNLKYEKDRVEMIIKLESKKSK